MLEFDSKFAWRASLPPSKRTILILARARHGQRAALLVRQFGTNFVVEKARLLAKEHAAERHAAAARAGGVARLRNEILVDIVKEHVIVVLELAQLDEILARLGALFDVQVEHEIALFEKKLGMTGAARNQCKFMEKNLNTHSPHRRKCQTDAPHSFPTARPWSARRGASNGLSDRTRNIM